MRRIGFPLAIALASALLAVPAPGASAQTPVYGGHLRIGYDLPPTSLDPQMGRSGGDVHYTRQMFDVLVDADLHMLPRAETSLARSWEFPDPLTLVLHLRPGVKFHDGTDFNAQAAKFNLDRILDPKTGATLRASFSAVKSVDVVDSLTVRLNLNRPWGPALAVLSGAAMNSPTAVAKLGQEYGFHPVGTGPFKLAEVVAGSHVRMVRNPDYWLKDSQGRRLPYLDEVTLQIIRDQNVIAAGLKTGEIDMAFAPPLEREGFQHNPQFNVRNFPGDIISFLLVFNRAKPPMDNVDLRLAIASAIDPDAINKAVFLNGANAARSGMWPARSWAYDESIPRPHYDPQKAREYLKLGGKPNGFTVEALSWPQDQLLPATEIAKSQLAQIGITVNLKVLSVGAATSQFFELADSAPLYMTTWTPSPEPDLISTVSFKSDGYYNPGKLPRPDMDRLIDAGARSYDLQERKQAYNKINAIVLGEAWYVPLIERVGYLTTASKVQGAEDALTPTARFDLRKVWIKP